MTSFEKAHVDRMCANGCRITGRYAEWHHWTTGLSGTRITKCHLFGIPLSPEKHRTDKDSVHMMGDEEEFCKLHGINKQQSIEDATVSLELWVSGKSRKPVTLRLV